MHRSSDRPYNDARYAVDDSKLRALGWSEAIDFDEGLREAVREYVRAFSGAGGGFLTARL